MSRVLVLDDDAIIRQMVAVSLKHFDAQILEASTGQQAMDLIQQTPPDVAILDVSLPDDISGLDVCRQLRQQSATTPIIMLSSQDQILDIEEAERLGANYYLTKPMNIPSLRAIMNDIAREGG